MNTTIRPLREADMLAASELIRRVFDQFEGPDYPAEGLATFYRIITPEALTARLRNGEMLAWGVLHGERLIGVLAVRDRTHISLLFVEPEYHRQGIAGTLFGQFRDFCRTDSSLRRITVNSSPFAAAVYPRLGFAPTDVEQTQDGIRFTPMEYLLYK